MEAYTHQPSNNGVITNPKNLYPYGAFYPRSNGLLLASQVVGILAIIAWVTALMVPFFGIFKFFGALRIPPEVEEMGLDRSKHGGSAYNTGGNMMPNPGNDVMRNQQSAKVLPLNN